MAELYYHDGFHGSYQIGNQTLSIGKDAIMPYDMTYGAIASCLYATYLGIAMQRMCMSGMPMSPLTAGSGQPCPQPWNTFPSIWLWIPMPKKMLSRHAWTRPS